jgi:hypothetical protein
MGRGRAKAKQTRVARELKYHSPDTDLAALQRELTSGGRQSSDVASDEGGEFLDDDEEEDTDDEDPSGIGHRPSRRG